MHILWCNFSDRGDSFDEAKVPKLSTERVFPQLADVDAHPDAASPYGVLDLVGNVYQWTVRELLPDGNWTHLPSHCYRQITFEEFFVCRPSLFNRSHYRWCHAHGAGSFCR